MVSRVRAGFDRFTLEVSTSEFFVCLPSNINFSRSFIYLKMVSSLLFHIYVVEKMANDVNIRKIENACIMTAI